jgi:hypothetical protein
MSTAAEGTSPPNIDGQSIMEELLKSHSVVRDLLIIENDYFSARIFSPSTKKKHSDEEFLKRFAAAMRAAKLPFADDKSADEQLFLQLSASAMDVTPPVTACPLSAKYAAEVVRSICGHFSRFHKDISAEIKAYAPAAPGQDPAPLPADAAQRSYSLKVTNNRPSRVPSRQPSVKMGQSQQLQQPDEDIGAIAVWTDEEDP